MIGDSGVDPTIPAVVIESAEDDNFAIRDLALARGAIQAASSRSGLSRIEFTSLLVVDHLPQADQAFVSTGLESIEIELSAVVPSDTVLSDFIEIYRGAVLPDEEGGYALGENVSADFDIGFAQRNGIDALRFVSCLLYTSPSPRDQRGSRMPSSA